MSDPTRRTQLADAAIATLAREGSRGLTHRAVDRTAGVAQGSTSYYFRTRASLLLAGVERLAELDAAALPVLAPADVPDRDAFVRAMAAVVHDLATTGRDRLLARYELSLEATRSPALRAGLHAGTTALRAIVRDRLEALGVDRPGAAARDFLVLLDGILLDAVTGDGDLIGDEATRSRLVERLLDACGVPR